VSNGGEGFDGGAAYGANRPEVEEKTPELDSAARAERSDLPASGGQQSASPEVYRPESPEQSVLPREGQEGQATSGTCIDPASRAERSDLPASTGDQVERQKSYLDQDVYRPGVSDRPADAPQPMPKDTGPRDAVPPLGVHGEVPRAPDREGPPVLRTGADAATDGPRDAGVDQPADAPQPMPKDAGPRDAVPPLGVRGDRKSYRDQDVHRPGVSDRLPESRAPREGHGERPTSGLQPIKPHEQWGSLERQMVCKNCGERLKYGMVIMYKGKLYPCLTKLGLERYAKPSKLYVRSALEHEISHIRDLEKYGMPLSTRIRALFSKYMEPEVSGELRYRSELKAYGRQLQLYESEARKRALTPQEQKEMDDVRKDLEHVKASASPRQLREGF
jgi:hypothetical protein